MTASALDELPFRRLLLAAPLLAALCAPLLASAQTSPTPGIDQRQLNQERRIDQGESSGSLTQQEANRLENGQERVQRIENRANADGVVTTGEQARLQKAENVQSRRIHRQKHDRQHDFNHNGRIDRR
ncbi:hypothetical protein [Rhodocyclus tenuis]|uniref:DUF4148 domain-containing protein n=1 Tax=Rhodocyclus tenuis TaxID=1066 RepID=A0A840G8M6_RHOTE|nr:hypothetical protein [Rhodocyclus tenuis]MBB4247791.1 hypothetical protein [Rhodocyclus tenuis]